MSTPVGGLSNLSLRDLVTTALFAVVVALFLRVFILGAYTIPSHSMENTLLEGDYVLVSKIAFAVRNVERGDVVVFTLPDSLRGVAPDELFVKRVVALGGDTVQLSPAGVYVNSRRLPDPPEAKQPSSPLVGSSTKDVTVVVPNNAYFVLGDNRSNSFDSRYWGFLPEDRVEGAPFMIFWSHGSTTTSIAPQARWDRIFTFVR